MLEQLQELLPDYNIDVEHNYGGDETLSLYTFYKDGFIYQVQTHNEVLMQFGEQAALDYITHAIREDEIAYRQESEL